MLGQTFAVENAHREVRYQHFAPAATTGHEPDRTAYSSQQYEP
jgi:hypothetical protein